jgi:hypothetical protein
MSLILSLTGLQAQFEVSLKLPRANYMALEPIEATVQITNRTGAVAVLGGPGRGEWLAFEMLNSTGDTLAQLDVDGSQILQMQPGASVRQKVVVTRAYSPEDMGNYGLRARVRASERDFYQSERVRFSIIDNKPIWERSFGVPEGFKEVGQRRRYALHIFRDYDSTSLYYRLLDDRAGTKLITRRLGPLSQVYDPQITLDATNHLQVLFMAQAHVFAHATIDPTGKIAKLTYYSDEGSSRPTMQQDEKGQVLIAGGTRFDPGAAPEQPKGGGGKPVSAKPPGL